jgi:hypothetical protein
LNEFVRVVYGHGKLASNCTHEIRPAPVKWRAYVIEVFKVEPSMADRVGPSVLTPGAVHFPLLADLLGIVRLGVRIERLPAALLVRSATFANIHG